MPDYYYKTVGEAWAAIANQFTAFGDLTYISLGFSVAWHSAGAPDGGYFTVDGTVYAGDAYANGNYHAQEAKTGAGLPFAKLLREPGMDVQPVVTSDPTVGRLTAATLRSQLYLARIAMAADVSDASSSSPVNQDVTLTGAGGVFITREWIQFVSAYDQTMDMVSVVDMRFAPSGAPVTQPVDPKYMVDNAPIVNNIIQTAPSLGVDATVNPGGGIYSITSRQLTTT